VGITLSNIEQYIYLFANGNTDFPHTGWAEPIYATMIRAYQNDEQLSVSIGSNYIRNMISKEYQQGKSYSPIEIISGRNGLEKISTHLTSIMLQNFSELGENDKRDLSPPQ